MKAVTSVGMEQQNLRWFPGQPCPTCGAESREISLSDVKPGTDLYATMSGDGDGARRFVCKAWHCWEITLRAQHEALRAQHESLWASLRHYGAAGALLVHPGEFAKRLLQLAAESEGINFPGDPHRQAEALGLLTPESMAESTQYFKRLKAHYATRDAKRRRTR